MGIIIQSLVTLCGVFTIIALLFILFCRHYPGWNLNWMANYLFGSTKEEKMVLTKPCAYNQNGCMIPSSNSDSEFALSGRGSFRHFDKTDQDYTLIRQTSNSSLVSNSRTAGGSSSSGGGTIIPPQPLRPAPIPPITSIGVGVAACVGPLQSQSSLDSVFTTAPNSPAPHLSITIIPHPNGNSSATSTPPHRGGCGGGDGRPSSTSTNSSSSNFSNNNPFLPLIQASTQFFTQKFQSFQQQSSSFHSNGSNNGAVNAPPTTTTTKCQSNDSNNGSSSRLLHNSVAPPQQNRVEEESTVSSSSNVPIASTTSTTKPGGMSMGEILFSSPPAHSLIIQGEENHQEQEQKESVNPATSFPEQEWPNVKSDQGVVMVEGRETCCRSTTAIMGDCQADILEQRSKEKRDSNSIGQYFPVNVDIGVSDRKSDGRSMSRENTTSAPNRHHQTTTFSNTSNVDASEQSRTQKSNNGGDHHIVTNLSTKPLSVSISESEDTTTPFPTEKGNCKSELQQQTSRSPSPSPTRLRDRQRKMELTLQHIQNNQEDRMKTCSSSSSSSSSVGGHVKKLHHNLDSHYPLSTPYVPKLISDVGCGDSTNKSMRYRSPHHHHRPIVPPPLKEADELALNDLSPPPPPLSGSSSLGGGGPQGGLGGGSGLIDRFNFNHHQETTHHVQPSIIKSFHRPSLNSSDDATCNKWILETMREEIEDATKSLMMDEEFSIMPIGEKKNRRKEEGNEGVGDAAVVKEEKESRPILKSLPLNTTTNSSSSSIYSSSSPKNKFKSHDLDKLNNAGEEEPSESAAAPQGVDGTLESSRRREDNTGIISYANYNGTTQESPYPSSHVKTTNLIPTEINPTGGAVVSGTILSSFTTSGGEGLENLEKTTFSSPPSNGGTSNGGYSNGGGGGGSSSSGYGSRPPLVERAHSYSSPSSSGGVGGQLSAPPFRNTRSFSLRQSSTDSIGSEAGSDGSGSPDGGNFLPALQRAMSCDSVSSDTSVVLGDLDPPHPTGFLCVGLEYDSETADLLVNVMEGKELVGPEGPNSMAAFDSYVRVYLLPDKTTNMQTRVYRKSLNPVYREKFMFGVETIELPLRTLVFYLYATDKYSNTLVGETEFKLRDLDIYQPITTWLQLTDTGQKGGESGEIMFSLSYLPTAERLTVVVVKARNLKFPQERDTGDPFVKVYLLQKGKKVSKKKSSTKRGEKNPIFNEAMIFSVPAHALQTIQLRITVADTSEIEGRANSIGHVIVGSQTAGKPLSHWNQMLSSLRKPIAMWHPLFK